MAGTACLTMSAVGRGGALGLWSATAMPWWRCGVMEVSRCGRASMLRSPFWTGSARCHRHRHRAPVRVQHSHRGKDAHSDLDGAFTREPSFILANCEVAEGADAP